MAGSVIPDIQILMPAYLGEDYIAEAVRSITSQTYQGWLLDVSFDGPDEGMRRVLDGFPDDRIRIHSQPERLGWPGNYNWLVEQATLPFVCYWQQDDIASHDYLADLRSTLLAEPNASIAYSDVQWFGDWRDRTALPSITGSPLERGLGFLEAIRYEPLRGLMRRSMISAPAIPPAETSDQMEFVLLTRMAIAGDLIRAKDSLYFKRKHAANAFSSWVDNPADLRLKAWTSMGAHIFEELRHAAPEEFAHRLLCLVIDRLCIDRPGRAFWTGPWNDPSHIGLVARELASHIDALPEETELANIELMKPVDPAVVTAVAELHDARHERFRPLESKVGPDGIQPFLVSGWSVIESWGVWSDGHRATIAFQPSPDTTSVRLGVAGFTPDRAQRIVEITCEGKTFRTELSDQEEEITIPIPDRGSHPVTVELLVPDPNSPFETLGLPDHRRLGVGLVHLDPVTE